MWKLCETWKTFQLSLTLKFIQTSWDLMRIFTQRKHHAKNNLIFARTPENGPVETGVTGPVATALTLFNEGIVIYIVIYYKVFHQMAFVIVRNIIDIDARNVRLCFLHRQYNNFLIMFRFVSQHCLRKSTFTSK